MIWAVTLFAIACALRCADARASSPSSLSLVERCEGASAYLSGTARETRKLYIPSIDHPEVGSTVTGRAGCMVTVAGWWTYEYCFGDYIRQFHAENGVVHDEYFIGVSGRALDKTSLAHDYLRYRDGGSVKLTNRIRALSAEGSGGSLNPLGAQYRYRCDGSLVSLLANKDQGAVVFTQYDSGSICGVTGKRRSATVFYICDATVQRDPTRRIPIHFDIAETEPCTYQIFVRGDNMCSMMQMAVPPPVASESTPEVASSKAKAAAATFSAKQRGESPSSAVGSDARRAPSAQSEAITDESSGEVPKGGVIEAPAEGPPVVNDGSSEAFEAMPVGLGDVPASGIADAPGKKRPSSMYVKGLDDPLYFEDSFILTI